MNLRNLSNGQKSLLLVLYFLVGLMIFFSIGALKNIGPEAYMECIQKNCEYKGEESCRKLRVHFSCCEGAGGEMINEGNTWACSFE